MSPTEPILDGKVVIVTGAARGIGAALAREIWRLGGSVILNDLDGEAIGALATELTGNGRDAVSVVGDASDWETARRLIDVGVSAFGRLDGLVNCAGVFEMGRLLDLRDGDIARVFASSVLATANCAHHAAKVMTPQGSGSIINVVSGAHMGLPAMGVYGAAKGAAASFTYAWSLELAGSGVRVNGVSPLALTRQVEVARAFQAAEHVSGPKGVLPDPSANVGAFIYLLSDASAAITGQILRVEGGALSLMNHPSIAVPVLERDAWTYEAVREAFSTAFKGRLAPVGVAAIDARPAGTGSQIWKKAPEDEA